MAIQNALSPIPGGTASALNVGVPTIIKAAGGTLWTVSLIQMGLAIGYLYDWNSLSNIPQGQVIAAINPALISTSSPEILPNPFRFFVGLVFVPGSDGMICSIAYA